MNNSALPFGATPFDLTTLALVLGAIANIGVVVEAYFLYKMWRVEQATYGLEQKRFLLEKARNVKKSMALNF
jgi:hypothetical protein